MQMKTIPFFIIVIGSAIVSPVNGFSGTKDVFLKRNKPYENPDLVEGDMLFPVSSQPTGRGVLRRGAGVAWTNGIVPYEISTGYAFAQQNLIIATMQKMERLIAINNVMCIQFRPRISSDPYYITIVNGYGCSSYVGQNTGISMARTVTLQHPGCVYEAIIMHELLHTLGFFHEQSRPDRDDYIRVNYANIISGLEHNFAKYNNTEVNTQNTPYDYASVMHYGTDAFSSNGLPTIEPLQSGVSIGQRFNMSLIDIQEVRLFYNCSTTGVTFPVIQTTTSVNLYVINVTVSSTLTTNSRMYTRYGSSGSNYYYETFEVTVPATGSYVFISNSTIDMYGYLYSGSFSPDSTSQNLLTYDDDSGDRLQFQFTVYLQPNVPYILVVTTFSPAMTGTYQVVASGLVRVNLVGTNNVSIISNSTATASTATTSRPATTNSSSIISNYSSALTINTPTYNRPGVSSMHHYEAIQMTVFTTGVYSFRSISNVDAYGYLYLNSFNPSNVAANLLIYDDDSDGSVQFLVTYTLQSTNTYVLVVTTYRPSVTTNFSVTGSGPARVTFVRMDIMSTTTPITRTTTPTTQTTPPTTRVNASTLPPVIVSDSSKSNVIVAYFIAQIICVYFINQHLLA